MYMINEPCGDFRAWCVLLEGHCPQERVLMIIPSRCVCAVLRVGRENVFIGRFWNKVFKVFMTWKCKEVWFIVIDNKHFINSPTVSVYQNGSFGSFFQSTFANLDIDMKEGVFRFSIHKNNNNNIIGLLFWNSFSRQVLMPDGFIGAY